MHVKITQSKLLWTIWPLFVIFFDTPKKQHYFKLLDNLQVYEIKRRDIIRLSKKRWVERYWSYENYYILHKSVTATFESIFMQHLYSEFYASLEDKFEEECAWNAKAKITKSQKPKHRVFVLFVHLLNSLLLFLFSNGLEPLKPLVVKL